MMLLPPLLWLLSPHLLPHTPVLLLLSPLLLSEGAPHNVLNFDPPRICFLSDFMLHIGALSALTPRGSDLTAEN